jgi:hypothetical protein
MLQMWLRDFNWDMGRPIFPSNGIELSELDPETDLGEEELTAGFGREIIGFSYTLLCPGARVNMGEADTAGKTFTDMALVLCAFEKEGETGVPGCSKVAIPDFLSTFAGERIDVEVLVEEGGEERDVSVCRPAELTIT